jgi:hypothetical protein
MKGPQDFYDEPGQLSIARQIGVERGRLEAALDPVDNDWSRDLSG